MTNHTPTTTERKFYIRRWPLTTMQPRCSLDCMLDNAGDFFYLTDPERPMAPKRNTTSGKQALPPLAANINVACYKCYKNEGEGVKLQRCGKCRRVSYCGSTCQKEDWPVHKEVCRGLVAIEHNQSTDAARLSTAPEEALSDPTMLDILVGKNAQNELLLFHSQIGRALTMSERNLIIREPRCLLCGKTDRLLRTEAVLEPGSVVFMLKPCPDCKLVFYCCTGHWERVKVAHMQASCPDGLLGMTQCQIAQTIREDTDSVDGLDLWPLNRANWAPLRLKENWISLAGRTWESEFAPELRKEPTLQKQLEIKEAELQELRRETVEKMRAGMEKGEKLDWNEAPKANSSEDVIFEEKISARVREASIGLSMPMSILWALENMNEDDAWTMSDSLTIHILGCGDREYSSGRLFEEILHQLPDVKTLRLVLCGPALAENVPPSKRNKVIEVEPCSLCKEKGRVLQQWNYTEMYHEYAKKQGKRFVKPDLAIAFQPSAFGDESLSTWKPIISYLIQNKIPTVFTAFSQDEAKGELVFLSECGVQFHPRVRLMRNPWGSISTRTEPYKICAFHSTNAWIVGGFK